MGSSGSGRITVCGRRRGSAVVSRCRCAMFGRCGGLAMATALAVALGFLGRSGGLFLLLEVFRRQIDRRHQLLRVVHRRGRRGGFTFPAAMAALARGDGLGRTDGKRAHPGGKLKHLHGQERRDRDEHQRQQTDPIQAASSF